MMRAAARVPDDPIVWMLSVVCVYKIRIVRRDSRAAEILNVRAHPARVWSVRLVRVATLLRVVFV